MLCFLIEDDLDDQEIFCLALNEVDENILCEVANDGEEALSILENVNSQIPEYIFIDVNMPKMNGIECLKGIRNLKHLEPSKIVMFSTTSEKRIIQLSKELGASDFIIKPPGLSTLTEKLSDILHRGKI